MAEPIIQSTGSTSGAGTPGEGRNDLVAAELVTLTDTEVANAGAEYQWTMVERPVGSTAVLLNPTTSSPSFVVDTSGTEGSYRVRCLVDTVDESIIVLAQPLPNTGSRIPSFQEEDTYNAGGNDEGWHLSQTLWMRAANSRLPYLLGADPTAGGGISAPIGSIGIRDNGGVGELWIKTGAGNTDWTLNGADEGGGVEQDTIQATATVPIPYNEATTIEATLGAHLFDGSLVAMSAHLIEPLTGGTVTVNIHTPSNSPALTVVLNDTNPQNHSASDDEGDLPVYEGDEVYVEVVVGNYVNDKTGNPETAVVVNLGFHRHPIAAM